MMRLRFVIVACALALAVQPAGAQNPQPYAGLQARAIKALSQEQIDDLRSGRGMGFALSAELNGYPGPRHVLDLADALQLSAEQNGTMSNLFSAMRAEVIPLGERLIELEAELDRQFAERRVTPASLATATGAIGAAQAALRAAHLKYHLLTDAALTPEQIRSYAALRGYGPDRSSGHEHGASHPN